MAASEYLKSLLRGTKTSQSSKSAPLSPQKKLQEYHSLAKETIQRAISAENESKFKRAISLYNHALQVIEEAFTIDVPSSGLGPKADNTYSIKQELTNLAVQVRQRLNTLMNKSTPGGHQMKKSAVQVESMVTKRRSPPTPSRPVQSVVDGVRRVGKVAKEVVTGESAKYRDMILGEMLVTKPGVEWDDIAGLAVAKQALYESVILPSIREDIFKDLRAPPRGLLLYGPPGNGKTLLAKALASKADAAFFNISASSLTSKWVGEGEKLVRALFEVAAEKQPSIIFIDEIDSILSSRASNEHEASRKLKTEFLVHFDGLASSQGRVIVIGATNRPHELDDAAQRRLVKRIYIPLPDNDARTAIIKHLFVKQKHSLDAGKLSGLVSLTEGYSASDLTALCKEASMVGIRELGGRIATVNASQLRPVTFNDFVLALNVIKPSVNKKLLQIYQDYTREFGTQ